MPVRGVTVSDAESAGAIRTKVVVETDTPLMPPYGLWATLTLNQYEAPPTYWCVLNGTSSAGPRLSANEIEPDAPCRSASAPQV